MSDFQIRGEKKDLGGSVQGVGEVPKEIVEALKNNYPAQFGIKETEDQEKFYEAAEAAAREAGEAPPPPPAKPLPSDPVNVAEQDASSGLSKEDLRANIKITEEDLNKYFESIIDDEPFIEKVTYRDITITLRSRYVKEVDEILARIAKDAPETVGEYESKLGEFYLCYSLVSVYTKKGLKQYDSGTLDERLGRVKSFSAPKYMMLLGALMDFDTKIDMLRERIYTRNF
jgi:hypothetical protein